MNVLQVVDNFNLGLLPNEWVRDVWASNFSNAEDFPPEYEIQEETEFLLDNMICTIDAFKDWKNPETGGSSRDRSWHILLENQFDYKPLICLISVFIKSEYSSQEARLLGVTASRLYVNLLSIPGSLALNIFNSHLFHKVLETLKLVKVCNKEFQKNKHKKKTVGRNTVDTLDSELSESDINSILFEIGVLLCDLSECFLNLHLRDEYGSIIETINILIDLTSIEKQVNVFQFKPLNKTSTAYICRKSYDILNQLCVKEQGEIKSTVNHIMSRFLPSMVTNEEDYKLSIGGRNEIRKHRILFIERLLKNNDPDVADRVVALLQQLCIRLPEKEDIKSRCVLEIISILKVFPKELFQEIVLWIVSLMHNKNLKHRLSAADIISCLLKINDDQDDGRSRSSVNTPQELRRSHDSEDSEKVLLYKTLIASILSGICDIASMRTKCLGIFSRLILSNHLVIKQIVHELFHPNLEFSSQPNDVDECIFNFDTFFCQNPNSFPNNPLPDGNRIFNILEILSREDKINNRKHACQTLANICFINENFLTKHILKILVIRCKDFYISIRKSVAKSLTDLVLHYPTNDRLISAWVDGVMPLIVDNETKGAEKIVQYLKSILIDNITYYDRSINDLHKLPWKLLGIISKKDKKNLLGIACAAWNQQGLLKNPLFLHLQSHTGKEHNSELWYLISCISEFLTIPNAEFIHHYFIHNIFSASKADEYVSLLVLEALFLNWKGLTSETKRDLFLKFKTEVETFQVPFPMISRFMDYCFLFKRKETELWSGTLMEKCETFLSQCIAPGSKRTFRENSMCQYIVTLGEAAHFHPGVSTECLSYLANLIDPNFSGIKGDKWTGTVSWRVRSVAIVTLGKVCLQDPLIAKFYAPLLASLLNKPSSPESAKINTMIALSDICRRFTAVVEDYLGDMCVSLRDVKVNVRKNTLTLLIALIQEDFLKLRCPLFFYVLMMRLDSSQEIRDLTDCFIVNNILKKSPRIMSQHFIHAIFFFNKYEGHQKYTMDDLSNMEKIVFSLAGINNFNDRAKIYRYMLLHMGDDDRFKVCNWLCIEILEHVCEDNIPLDSRGNAVLKDALSSISYKEMRLENLRNSNEDKENGEVFITEMTKQLILSSLIKKNYMETIVPIIVRLKNKLMKYKSPLLKDVMVCLRELMKDYKDEINEILLDDPILAAEIKHDLKNFVEDKTFEEPAVLQIGDVIMKELRIQCERLTEDVLLNQFNISTVHTDSHKKDNPSPRQRSKFPTVPIAGPSGVVRTPVKRQGVYSPMSPSPLKRQVRSQSSLSGFPGPSGTTGKRQRSVGPLSPTSNGVWGPLPSPGRLQNTSCPIAGPPEEHLSPGPSGEHLTSISDTILSPESGHLNYTNITSKRLQKASSPIPGPSEISQTPGKRQSCVTSLSQDSGHLSNLVISSKDQGRYRKTSSPRVRLSEIKQSSITPLFTDSGSSNDTCVSLKDQGRNRKTSSPNPGTSGEPQTPGPSRVTPLSPDSGYSNDTCISSNNHWGLQKASSPISGPREQVTPGKKKSYASPSSTGYLCDTQSKETCCSIPESFPLRCWSSSGTDQKQYLSPKKGKKKNSQSSQLPAFREMSEVEIPVAPLYLTSPPHVSTDPMPDLESRKPKQHRKRKRRKSSTSSTNESS